MLIINLKNVIIEYHCATIEVLQSRGGQVLMNFITFLVWSSACVHCICTCVWGIVKLNHCPVGGCNWFPDVCMIVTAPTQTL